jgi:hypothetical protein
MTPSRTSLNKDLPAAGKSPASVKSNAGDDLRGSSGGHSTGRKTSKLEMIEPASASSSRAEGYPAR